MDSSGRAPGWPSTSASSASTSSGSTARPTRCAGRSIARRQLVARHRADEHVVGAEQARQLGIGGAAAVEVRAHGEHDDGPGAGGADEPVGELAALLLVLARGEQLLELVDRQHGVPLAREAAGRPAQLAQRLLAGTDHRLRPVLAARQHAAGERGQQPGPHDRGLAAARRADDREQRRADEARDQLGHEPLAPEEVLGVVGVERGEALVRADQRPGRRRRCRGRRGPRGRAPTAARRRCRPARPRARASRCGPRPCGRRRRRRGASPRAAPTRSPPRGRGAATPRLVASSVSTGICAVGRRRRSRRSPARCRRRAARARSTRAARAARAPPPAPVASTRTGTRSSAGYQLAQRRAHLGGRAVGVVDHEQRRALGGSRVRASTASAASGAPVPAA